MIDPSFWLGRRVFLTGHTGFKGGWMSLWLQQLGAELTGFALPPATTPSFFDVARVGPGMTSLFGDIRDASALTSAVTTANPEIVIHMAAQPLVRYSYAQPVETYSTNVMGLVNLFEAVRATPGVRAVVNVTSDKCYENNEQLVSFTEAQPMGGFDPYSSSKGCAELVTSAYRRSYFGADGVDKNPIALASGRAGNVIGGGDWSLDRLVPDILLAFSERKPVRIRSPQAVRPWQHVLEPIYGYLALAERLVKDGHGFAEGWNFGPMPSDTQPVQWVVWRMSEIWGDGAMWELDGGQTPHEAKLLMLDCTKAIKRLDWAPRWGLESALTNTVDWHKSFLAQQDMYECTVQQITEYQSIQGVKNEWN